MLVQFGNNWIQKIPLTAKLDSACGLVQFWLSSEFFSSNYFQIGQHLHLQENDTVFTDKKQVAELFNEHFVHIADGVGEITDHHYGEGFYDHPSIKVIQANIGTKGEEDCLSCQLTNAT